MITLRELLHSINVQNNDIDIYVDGIDGIAVCAPVTLTDEGEREFADVMDMEVDGYTIIGDDKDYEDLEDVENDKTDYGGRLELAWQLLTGLAGYCSCANYDKWFKNGKRI